MKILFVGPRIQDIGGFAGNDLQTNIKSLIQVTIANHHNPAGLKNDNIIILTDAFPGIGFWSANWAQSFDVKYHLYSPFKDCHIKWPKFVQESYKNFKKSAIKRIELSKEGFSYDLLIEKDIRMINDADLIYSFYPDDKNKIHKLINKFNKTVKILQTTTDDWYIEI